jgi:hypothetical protein
MRARDARVSFVSEVLQGVKLLKLFAWEPPTLKEVSGALLHVLAPAFYSTHTPGGMPLRLQIMTNLLGHPAPQYNDQYTDQYQVPFGG